MQSFASLDTVIVRNLTRVRDYPRHAVRSAMLSLTLALLVATSVVIPSATPAHAAGVLDGNITSELNDKLSELRHHGHTVKHVAFGKGDDETWVVLYGRNSYFGHSVPRALVTRLDQLNSAGWEINFVELGADDTWVVVYGGSGYSHSGGLPAGVVEALERANRDGSTINYVMMNARGHYLVDTSARIAWSLPEPAHSRVAGLLNTRATVNGVLFGTPGCFEGCDNAIAYVIIYNGTEIWKEAGCCNDAGGLRAMVQRVESGNLRVKVATAGHSGSWIVIG